jgi:hypothetical protein
LLQRDGLPLKRRARRADGMASADELLDSSSSTMVIIDRVGC